MSTCTYLSIYSKLRVEGADLSEELLSRLGRVIGVKLGILGPQAQDLEVVNRDSARYLLDMVRVVKLLVKDIDVGRFVSVSRHG
jgi:hypothetical protein